MKQSIVLSLFLILSIVTVCFSVSDCKFDCGNDKSKICGTSVKPKKYGTIRTFDSECLMKKHNCENSKDGNEIEGCWKLKIDECFWLQSTESCGTMRAKLKREMGETLAKD
jgi:hypothetical protein